ncbi:MAG: SulP family inorganic anion transporter [Clostridia bacterium]|nr:SulP family inorganic anion transporter [Clostridia bacterium]
MFIKKYIAMLKNEFSGYNGKKFSKDLLAGLTVTAVALPLALAFGIQCGATAEAGLITAIIAGLIIGALSGASYQISGPTGAMSAVLIGVVSSQLGLNGVFVVSLIAGILILLCAVFKLGKFVSKIPKPVITGFTSGIALIIALGQIQNFFGLPDLSEEVKHENSFLNLIEFIKAGFNLNLTALLLGLIVIVVMLVWPKKWNMIVPSSLVGIVVATLISLIPFFSGVELVGEIPQKIFLDDRFSFASIDFKNFFSYISPAISIAALAIIESLLCGASASKMKKEEFDANQELIAQGVGNIVIPFFGGVPATAAIARTSVAIKSGCQTRIAGIIHALGLLASMFLLGPVMAKIPLSALAGVLMVTAWRMNEWDSIKEIFSKKYYTAIAKFLITMIATIAFDLTIAIVIGIVFSIFVYLFNVKFKPSKTKIEQNETHLKNEITIKGSIFFNNISKIEKMILSSNSVKTIISLENVVYIDTSAIEMLTEAKHTLEENQKALIIHTPNAKIEKLMQKTMLISDYAHVSYEE